jgi:hypothetical protein
MPEGLDKLIKMAEALAAITSISLNESHQAAPIQEEAERQPEQSETNQEKDLWVENKPEAYGPKKAELPDPIEYLSFRMWKFIDV